MPNILLNQFVCQNPNCKKEVLIPMSADTAEYGYWYDSFRCCSYSCMRKLEKMANDPFVGVTTDQKKSIKHRNAQFVKLEKFMQLLEEGVSQDVAAFEAGFSAVSTANEYRCKYYGSDLWKQWMAKREDQNKKEVESAC